METTEAPLCSKCSSQLDTEGYPRWCKNCRATYKREYEALKADRASGKGFLRGIEALRETLAGEFERLGSGNFTAYEVAHLIRQTPAPKMRDSEI